MFHRRLLLMLVVFLSCVAVLALQLGRLTLIQGDDRLAEAKTKLVRREWTPTLRGSILDRKGRILAQDRPSYTVSVDYRVLTGEWAAAQARSAARKAAGDRWLALDPEDRTELIASQQRWFEAHVDRMWRRLAEAGGEDEAEIRERAVDVVRRVERMHASIARARRATELRERAAAGLPFDDEEIRAIDERSLQPIREQRSGHPILTRLDDEAGFRLLRLSRAEVPLFVYADVDTAPTPIMVPLLPGVEVMDRTDRMQPFERAPVAIDRSTLPGPIRGDDVEEFVPRYVASHLIGRVRLGVQAEDAQRRAADLEADAFLRERAVAPDGTDRGKYWSSDAVGATGIERAMESRLRGVRGMTVRRLDVEETVTQPPVRGSDVRLTIDAMLQARVTAIMDPAFGLTTVQAWHGNTDLPVGTPLAGAAVVLDIQTGEILAMVSSPGHLPDDPDPVWAGVDPAVNRAIAVPYPPGSIAKAMMLAGSVTRGHHRLGRGVVCTGHFLPDEPELFRCWIFKRYGLKHGRGFEPVLAAESLKVSCNIFYYEQGRRMGPETVAAVYRDFGLGRSFGLGIGPEWPGGVGAFDGPGDGSDLSTADAVLMAIGQGPVTWTPLHAANAVATLARGGVWLAPKLVLDGSPPDVDEFTIDARVLDEALRGLHDAVTDREGTGSTISVPSGREPIFNVPGVSVAGKTGTATAPPLLFDPDGEGPEPRRVVRTGDHSWFVVLAGPEGGQHEYAVAVIIEYGGSGGRVAGPVTNQVLHALVAEGYLPGGPDAGTSSASAGGGRR